MAGTDISKQTNDAGGDGIGQQSGLRDLGNTTEERGLSESGAGYGSMKLMPRKTA